MRNHDTGSGSWQSGGDYPRNDGFLGLMRETMRELSDGDQRKAGALDDESLQHLRDFYNRRSPMDDLRTQEEAAEITATLAYVASPKYRIRHALGKVTGLFGVRRNEDAEHSVLPAADTMVSSSDVFVGEVTTDHPVMAVYADENETPSIPSITRLQPPQPSDEA